MTKPGLSLFTKILLWFFLNIFVLAAIPVGLLNIRPQLPPYSPFGLWWMGGRFPTAAHLVSVELSEAKREKWPAILQKNSDSYDVGFTLFLGSGREILGQTTDIPMEVVRAVQDQLIRQIPLDLVPPEVDGPPPAGSREGPDFIPSAAPPGQRFAPPPPDFFARRPPRPQPFFIRTSNPTRYWLGAPVLVMAEGVRTLRPAVLAAVSDSVTGGGLFFDPWPWIIAAAGAVLISVLLWWPLVRHITKPLARMTEAADRMAQGRFDVRIDEDRRDEIGRLARAINDMSTQLSRFIQGQKRFLGDAAHELASPIARIQLGLGILEQKSGTESDDHLQGVIEDVGHMSNLVNELLSFSRAEAGPVRSRLQETLLVPVIKRAVDREATPDVAVRVEASDGATAWADPELLGRALDNLLRNAVRFAGRAGPILIQVMDEGEVVHIVVRDSGPGVPEADLPRLFEPFYRPEVSRRRETGGVGLGLSIVKAGIQACGGRVSCRNLKPSGFEARIVLRQKRDDRPAD
ncbi:MAG: HAMP domain-containing sensor histidine kinase [Pseudomonadota bacterium]